MIAVDKAVIARLKKGGKVFEVLVDCDQALLLKQNNIQSNAHGTIVHGNAVSMQDLLAYEKIFVDSKKGVIASEHLLQELFKTTDVFAIAKEIIKKGELQLTTAIRDRLREQKRKRIIEFIHKNAIDPQTNYPHPMQRLELAFTQQKIKVDEFKEEQKQVDEIIKKLQPILPIKIIEKKH